MADFSPHANAFLMSFYASMGTFVGGLLIAILLYFVNAKSTMVLMGILQSLSAGVMLYITCFHLIPESVEIIGNQETMIYFFVGVASFGVLEHWIIPHEQEKSSKKKNSKKVEEKQLMRASLITFIAMAMHNLPEGLGVYLSSLSNPTMGLKLAVAIMLHNIPEGMAVAIPLYAAKVSHSKVLWWTFVNGMAEPIGVILGGGILGPYLTPQVLNRCLALVGGIMMCISIHELLPMAIKYSGKDRSSVFFFVGMFICWFVLELVQVYFDGHHHHGHDHSFHGHDHHGHSHHDHGHGHHHGHSPHGHSPHGHHHGHSPHGHAHHHGHDHHHGH